MNSETKPGKFKTWGELLKTALTSGREIQLNFLGEWVRSNLNRVLADDKGMLDIREFDVSVSLYRLKPNTQRVYFGYCPTSADGAVKHWATDFYADEALARKEAPSHWLIGTAEIEVD